MIGLTGTEMERRQPQDAGCFQDPQRAQGLPRCQLQDLVDNALQRERPGLLGAVRAHVSEGEVQLTGHVPTYYAKQLAQHAAMSVPGVVQLRNDVDVL